MMEPRSLDHGNYHHPIDHYGWMKNIRCGGFGKNWQEKHHFLDHVSVTENNNRMDNDPYEISRLWPKDTLTNTRNNVDGSNFSGGRKSIELVFLSSFWNIFKLFSPKLWIGAFLFMSDIGMDIAGFFGSLTSLLFLCMIMYPTLDGNANLEGIVGNSANVVWRVILLTFLSPWSLSCIIQTIFPVGRSIFQKIMIWATFRKDVDINEILSYFRQQQQHKKYPHEQPQIIRNAQYDLYLPPSFSSAPTTQSRISSLETKMNPDVKQGLVLFPGAMIDHTSYMKVAHQLAYAGIVVMIPSMEPLRLASPFLGADLRHIRSILRNVQSKMNNTQMEWTFGGHSFGGYAALRLACQIHKNKTNNNRKDVVVVTSKVVVWAAGHMLENFVKNPCDLIPLQILFVHASQDAYCQFDDLPKFQKYIKGETNAAIFKCIKGGNHSGFASYPMNQQLDGGLSISRHRQQQLACQHTIKFLFHDNNKSLHTKATI